MESGEEDNVHRWWLVGGLHNKSALNDADWAETPRLAQIIATSLSREILSVDVGRDMARGCAEITRRR